ncbi:MAG: FxsA family protein [Pseudomonadota bacterium]
MPFSLIPFALLAIPIAEIAMFILLGGAIGLWPTLAMIFVTAIIGSILLRVQGFGILNRIQSDLSQNRVPAREMVHGVMIMIAGVLLLTPGFITDTLGFLLFVPPLRDAGWAFLRSRIKVVGPGGTTGGFHREPQDGTINLDPEDYTAEPDPSSPWRDEDSDRSIDHQKRR